MVIRLKNTTRWLLIISLIWIIIDGIFRKWLLPQFSTPIFAIKYILFGTTYALHFYQTLFFIPKIKHLYQVAIFILLTWCVFTLSNPKYETSILIKTFGLINYLFFAPLIIIVPYYFNKIITFHKIIRFLGIISIPIFAIGIIQYFLPVDHLLNYLPNDDQKYSRVAEYTRSISIFSFVKIYNVYLLFVINLFFVYIYYLIKNGKSAWFYIALVITGLLNQFMTGSRLPVTLSFIFIAITTLYILLKVANLRKSIIITMIFGIMITLSLYTFTTTFNNAINAFLQRATFVEQVAEKGIEGYSAKDRTIDRLTIFKFSDQAGWIGFGIGTTYQGTGLFLSKVEPGIQFEEEGERIVLEIGILGGIIMILLRASFLIYALNFLAKVKSLDIALFILPLTLYLIPPAFFLNNNTFNYFDGFSYWLAFALIIALNKINHKNETTFIA